MKPMAGEDARSFWIAEPRRGEIRAETLRGAEAGDAVVRTLYSGVSRGTETLVFTGAVPPSERERMRAPFQAGEFPAPVKYGYDNVGDRRERAGRARRPTRVLPVSASDALRRARGRAARVARRRAARARGARRQPRDCGQRALGRSGRASAIALR